MKVSIPIPSLVNGVSQQAPSQRLPTQHEAGINVMPSLVEGACKRPPTTFVSSLWVSLDSSTQVHVINRDADERYIVVVSTAGTVRVFDRDGSEYPVTGCISSYLQTTEDAKKAFRFLTIRDYTFITNRGVKVGMTSDRTPTRNNEVLIWVRQGIQSCTYSVSVDTDGDGSADATGSYVNGGATPSTQTVATDLYNDLVAAGITGPDWSISRRENVIYVRKVTDNNWSLTVTDDKDGDAIRVVRSSIQRFTDLPSVAQDGFKVHVLGDPGSTSDDYWAEFVSEVPGQIERGSWVETIAPDVPYKIDPQTLPHQLVRTFDSGGNPQFTFGPAAWADKEVGDETSSPPPSIVGSAISDLFLFKNRLGFLAGDTTLLSRAGRYLDLWRSTVVTLLDDDPIDVKTNSAKVTSLKSAVPFQDRLILFSEQSQFVLRGGDLLTPSTVSITPVTTFDALPDVSPIAAGPSVFFGTPRADSSNYSGVREFFVTASTEVADASDVTSHVPRFISGTIQKLTAATGENLLVAQASGDENSLWVYRWFWSQDQKIQSAWERWEFTDAIEAVEFVNTDLWIVFSNSAGAYLAELSVVPAQKDADGTRLTYLDSRYLVTEGTYDDEQDTTTFEVPLPLFGWDPGSVKVVAAPGSPDHEGYAHVVERIDSTSVTVAGEVTGPVWVGLSYVFSFTFTPPQAKPSDGGPPVDTSGRFLVDDLWVAFRDTGGFSVTVEAQQGVPFTLEWVPRNAGEALADEAPVESSSFHIPIRLPADGDGPTVTIYDPTHRPLFLTHASWSGRLTVKHRRL